MKLRNRHIRIALILLILVVGIFGLTSVDTTLAHGKELTLTVSSLVPDRSEPLRRMYRVHVAYAGDFDLVEGADVSLTGTRREGGEVLSTHQLIELPSDPGVYVVEVVFNRFGDWELEFDVRAALGQGDGRASLTESITPVVLSSADQAALLDEADRVQRLQVFFAFKWWPDIASIVIRIVHTLSVATYAVIVGSVLLAAWLGGTGNRILTGRIGEKFLTLSALSLGGILLSGLYGAAFGAPNAAPGIYEFRDLLQLPYGDAYLAAFLLKPVGWLAMVVFVLKINAAVIKPAYESLDASSTDIPAGPPIPSGAADDTVLSAPDANATGLKRLTGIGTALAVIAIADLSLVINLHYLSHLGVFLPVT